MKYTTYNTLGISINVCLTNRIELKVSKGVVILKINDKSFTLKKNNEKVLEDVRYLKKFIKNESAKIYVKEINNDWIGNYKHEAHPKSLMIHTKKILRHETNTLISARMGCQIEENFAHPSTCKSCKTTEKLIHTYLTCNPALKKLWELEFNEIQKEVKEKIEVVWEDQLDRNLLQLTPRGVISNKLGEILEKKKKDYYIQWIQDIAGSFLTKIRNGLQIYVQRQRKNIILKSTFLIKGNSL